MAKRRDRPSSIRRSPFAAAALAAALWCAPPAWAGENNGTDEQLAAKSFANGKAAFSRSDFVAAAKAFEEAASLSPHPAALLNAAEAWELAGKPARATALCERVLGMEKLEDAYRDTALSQLAKLARQVATLDIVEPASGFAAIDGEAAEALPLRRRLDPGKHTVSILSAPSRPEHSETIELKAGEQRTFHPALPPPAARARATSGSEGPPLATWIAFGGGAAFAAVGGLFGILTLNARDAFNATPTIESRDDFYRDRLITNVALGASAAALIAGGVLWLTHTGSPRTPSAERGLPNR